MKFVLLLILWIMLKNCHSGCGLKHPPPYGSHFKAEISGKMASPLEERMKAAGFTGRDDPKYLEYMEREVLKTIEEKGEEVSAMKRLLDRLDDMAACNKAKDDCLLARLDKIESASTSAVNPPFQPRVQVPVTSQDLSGPYFAPHNTPNGEIGEGARSKLSNPYQASTNMGVHGLHTTPLYQTIYKLPQPCS